MYKGRLVVVNDDFYNCLQDAVAPGTIRIKANYNIAMCEAKYTLKGTGLIK